MEEEVERLTKPEKQGVCCEIMSPTNVRNYTHKASLTRMHKSNLNKDNNRQDKVGGAQLTELMRP